MIHASFLLCYDFPFMFLLSLTTPHHHRLTEQLDPAHQPLVRLRSSTQSAFSKKLLVAGVRYPTVGTHWKVFECSECRTPPQWWPGDVRIYYDSFTTFTTPFHSLMSCSCTFPFSWTFSLISLWFYCSC